MEEKKTYDYTNTVTISTEEYRELIDERATFKCESENYRAAYYKALNEIKLKDLEIESLKDKAERFYSFVDELIDKIYEEAPDA